MFHCVVRTRFWPLNSVSTAGADDAGCDSFTDSSLRLGSATPTDRLWSALSASSHHQRTEHRHEPSSWMPRALRRSTSW